MHDRNRRLEMRVVRMDETDAQKSLNDRLDVMLPGEVTAALSGGHRRCWRVCRSDDALPVVEDLLIDLGEHGRGLRVADGHPPVLAALCWLGSCNITRAPRSVTELVPLRTREVGRSDEQTL